jgi:hypothetical protein
VNTENQAADIFTKSLARPLFQNSRKTWIDIIEGNVTYHFLLLLDLMYHTPGWTTAKLCFKILRQDFVRK